ncbi:MAG: flagellar hook protein FlgE [Hydrogenophaga sp.]|uniref:Flagellar hook protein FlgE n=1 Tax=Hydrogenophaga crocea TaxID=2716225 RepID=A0A6G8IMK9_9BURK|nr:MULTISPECIES: flagellar hook protein FlgE [Hydrogenophaga]MBL0943255.1 flagellar hook protein FlgE [Hydrogenophaga sp.]QIM54353.1 flagellar hook protein FlgE [Hydrogenophaga crocea]
MAFQQGLSGLNSASKNLDVIGHNIANGNTVGMKSSRAEFAEVYASSVNAAGGVNQGIGVSVASVSQQFTQGNITITGNDLDVAINGAGFFELTMPNGTVAYSRAGMFKLDDQGNIVTNQGGQLMGYPTDAAGNRLSFNPVPLSLPTASPIPAQQTGTITAEFNLDARAPVWNTATPPTPLSTYGTSLVCFDSQGIEIPVNLAFRKVGNNSWEVYTGVNGADPALSTPFTVNFLADGSLDTATTTIPPLALSSPNGTFNVNLDFNNITQFGTAFGVTELDQDGYRPGQFIGLKINENGVVTGQYSNGETRAAGQIALVNFRNAQGLQPGSGGNWSATFTSGEPLRGEAGSGNFGKLRAGALEDSNVDITAELVNMMTAQRAYQANAQTIKTQDQVLSTLLNMR